MENVYRPNRLLCAALALALGLPLAPLASAQQAAPKGGDKDLIAVIDFEPVGASKTQASALSDRMREELLRTGRYTLVDRAQMDNVLKEQALQQTGCTSQECAVQVGKMLGVRKLITGRITKVDENLWLLSAQLVDVETAETQKAESVEHEGNFRQMLTAGAAALAAKMAEGAGAKPAPRIAATPAVPKAAPPAVAQPAAPQATQPPQVESGKGGSSWIWWTVGGAVALGLIAASSSSSSSKKKDTSCTTCGTVNVSW